MEERSPMVAIGWDVGGWNCDKNANSRDAVAIIDGHARLLGEVWRGNLATAVLAAENERAFLLSLYGLCRAGTPPDAITATLAIDTPLGFSREFVALLQGAPAPSIAPQSSQNQYLYRHTERLIAQEGRAPLSAIKDMIGSQSTKGMHAVAKLCPLRAATGVWSGDLLTAIETYPTVSRDHPAVKEIVDRLPQQSPGDRQDALVCAAVAYLFATRPECLASPPPETPAAEGWIWRPVRD